MTENPIKRFLTEHDNSVYIPPSDWEKLKEDYDKEELITYFSDEILNGNIGLPMKRLALADAEYSFKKLCDYMSNDIVENNGLMSKYEYAYPISNKMLDEPNIGNNASDYFQQYNRFCAEGKANPSPVRTWENRKFLHGMLSSLWSLKVPQVDTKTLRTAIALRKYMASQFKPAVAKSIYEKCKSVDVLDFSSGWGDRLCGFYAAKNTKSYIGIDPNTAVYKKYFEQIELYRKLTEEKKVTLYNSPAEDVSLDAEIVDTIFTSPPYFGVEKYCQQENQSWVRYKEIDAWLEGFMYPTLDLCWKALKPNGFLILNISDVYIHGANVKICDPMNDYIKKLGGSYVDGIGMKMATRPNCHAFEDKDGVFVEPVWVWQKSDHVTWNPFEIKKRVDELF